MCPLARVLLVGLNRFERVVVRLAFHSLTANQLFYRVLTHSCQVHRLAYASKVGSIRLTKKFRAVVHSIQWWWSNGKSGHPHSPDLNISTKIFSGAKWVGPAATVLMTRSPIISLIWFHPFSIAPI